MTTFSQNPETNDIETHAVTVGGVTKRYLSFNNGKQAYADIIGDAIRTVRGELQLDTGRCVPYFETVFKSVNGIDIWKNDVRKRVLEFPFVKSIDACDVSYANRRLEYTMHLTTDAGDVTVTQ